MEHSSIDADADGGIALFDPLKSWSAGKGAFRDNPGREPATASRISQVVPELAQEAPAAKSSVGIYTYGNLAAGPSPHRAYESAFHNPPSKHGGNFCEAMIPRVREGPFVLGHAECVVDPEELRGFIWIPSLDHVAGLTGGRNRFYSRQRQIARPPRGRLRRAVAIANGACRFGCGLYRDRLGIHRSLQARATLSVRTKKSHQWCDKLCPTGSHCVQRRIRTSPMTSNSDVGCGRYVHLAHGVLSRIHSDFAVFLARRPHAAS